jgi:CDP-diacylglycerol---glycerol-3-phosphate 3-phosphatidyltransferase
VSTEALTPLPWERGRQMEGVHQMIQDGKEGKYKMYNIPNILSLSRIGATVPIFFLILMNEPQSFLLATVLFTLAAATDFFDGYIARHLGSVSSIGGFLDLTADKIFVSTILIALVQVEIIPAWIVAVIVTGEILLTDLRSMAMTKSRVIPAGKWSKRNAAITMIAIGGLLLAKGLNAYQLSLFPPRVIFNRQTLHINEILLLSIEILLMIIVLFSVLFGARYIIKTFQILQRENKTEPNGGGSNV